RLDARCPDEDAAERVIVAGKLDVRLEAVHLPSVPVSSNDHVEAPEVRLTGHAVDGVARKEDHPGARSEDRTGEAPDRFLEPVEADQAADRGRFTARDDEAVEPAELLGEPYLDHVRAELSKRGLVLAEVPLDGQDADSERTP